MTKEASEVIIFDNLIEADTEKANPLGQALSMSVAKPFQASNAAGAINHMDLTAVSNRAVEFGKRFKSGMISASA